VITLSRPTGIAEDTDRQRAHSSKLTIERDLSGAAVDDEVLAHILLVGQA
jgi:hypothetical protein